MNRDEYPHHTLRVFLVPVHREKNVRFEDSTQIYSTLVNATIFALLINGVKLRGTAFCIDVARVFGNSNDQASNQSKYLPFKSKNEESEGISLTVDIINKKILQVLSFEDIGTAEYDLIAAITNSSSETLKALVKTFVLNSIQ